MGFNSAFKGLKTKINLNYIYRFISYRAVDALHLDCKNHTVSDVYVNSRYS